MIWLLRWLRTWLPGAAWEPLSFPKRDFETVDDDVILEEEGLPDYDPDAYYPMTLGDVLVNRYQVIGKLGFGTSSTVWLARDMHARTHVTLKVYTRRQDHKREFETCQRIGNMQTEHPGFALVRSALDTFTISRDGGDHLCLVQQPLWDSFDDMIQRNPDQRFTEDLLKAGLRTVFYALDFLHTECSLVHTDIKGDNILTQIEDQSILDGFVKAELQHPSPRKMKNGVTIYASRAFPQPKSVGMPVLGDIGEAVCGDEARHHDAQPNIYRSPEIMLEADWSYAVDIWNVGVMIWDLFEGKHMFVGDDPDGEGYSTKAHLAELIGMLGLPPRELLGRGRRVDEFFNGDGLFIADVPVVEASLEGSEERLGGENKKAFLAFMRRMLQWRPDDRATARELLQDPWLQSSSR